MRFFLILEVKLLAFYHLSSCSLLTWHACPLLCWATSFLYPICWGFLWQKCVEFCHMLFIHLQRRRYDFYGVIHLFSCGYWTICVPRRNSIWSCCLVFLYVVELDYPIFCWKFLHLCSLGTFVVIFQLLSPVWILPTPWTTVWKAPCPLQSPGVRSSSCPLSWWCYFLLMPGYVLFEVNALIIKWVWKCFLFYF